MVLRAFIDDSYVKNGSFVLGGYIASVEAWASFAVEWEQLLPTCTRSKDGVLRFKMSEMQRYMNRALPFYRVIEEYVSAALWCHINEADLERAKQRIWSEVPLVWSTPTQPFWFCFSGLLSSFHQARATNERLQGIIPLEKTVDFYFDKRSLRDSAEVADNWDEFLESQANDAVRSLYKTIPRFESDEEFLPLQAADLCAWFVRRAFEQGTKQEAVFADLKPRKSLPIIGITFSEDQLVSALINKIRTGRYRLIDEVPVYDAKHNPRPDGHPVFKMSSADRRRLRSILRGN